MIVVRQVRSTPTPTARGVLVGLGLYRVVTAVWAAVVVLVDARSGVLTHASVAFAVLGPVLAWSIVATWLARTSPGILLRAPAQALDLALGAAVVITEWVVYDGAHPLLFGAMWQLAPVISVGLAYGAVAGLCAGLALGLLNGVAGAIAAGIEGRVLATLSAIVLFGVAGAASGGIMDRLRRAEDEVAEARARERVARTLHDGVLQTLAAVQRRSTDAALVELAAEQDRELRRWLRDDAAPPASGTRPWARNRPTGLGSRLRQLADGLEARDGARVELVVVDEPALAGDTADALVGAVGEAVTNAMKHGAVRRVTVFLDTDDSGGVLCTVHDDGAGFDPSTTAHGLGMTNSMCRPVEAAGGTVQVRSRPGAGTEVEFRFP